MRKDQKEKLNDLFDVLKDKITDGSMKQQTVKFYNNKKASKYHWRFVVQETHKPRSKGVYGVDIEFFINDQSKAVTDKSTK